MGHDDSKAIAMEYAQALFDLALEREQLEVVGQELFGLGELLGGQGGFSLFLESPSISRKQKLASLLNIFGGRLSDLVMNFLKVVNRRGRLSLLVAIVDCYAVLEDKRSGVAKGKLTTAVKLDDKEFGRLCEQISGELGRKLSLESETDESIIGGMVLTVEGVVMDGSVRRSLQRLGCSIRRQMGVRLLSNSE